MERALDRNEPNSPRSTGRQPDHSHDRSAAPARGRQSVGEYPDLGKNELIVPAYGPAALGRACSYRRDPGAPRRQSRRYVRLTLTFSRKPPREMFERNAGVDRAVSAFSAMTQRTSKARSRVRRCDGPRRRFDADPVTVNSDKPRVEHTKSGVTAIADIGADMNFRCSGPKQKSFWSRSLSQNVGLCDI